jgi:hypothetical protein
MSLINPKMSMSVYMIAAVGVLVFLLIAWWVWRREDGNILSLSLRARILSGVWVPRQGFAKMPVKPQPSD